MLLRKNHRDTGMDLRYELIRLACDNRASAQPFSRFGIFPVLPEPGKGERASVFHGDRERQLRFSRFAPFVESVRGDEAAAFYESLPKGGRFIDCLSPDGAREGFEGNLDPLQPSRTDAKPQPLLARDNHVWGAKSSVLRCRTTSSSSGPSRALNSWSYVRSGTLWKDTFAPSHGEFAHSFQWFA